MEKSSRVDFGGQPVYVGIDVHRRNWSVCILTEHLEHKTFSQPPEVEKLVSYVRREFPGSDVQCAYEAGFSGFWAHEGLVKAGFGCLVANPGDIPTMDKERVRKSDGVDCRKTARELRDGRLKGIYVPARAAVEDRSLLRTRQGMVRKQTRCKNQIKGMLYFLGVPTPPELGEGNWSKRHISWLESLQLERPSGTTALKVHVAELRHLREVIARLDLEIRELARTDDYRESVHLLQTIPGISILTAMTLLTELVDMSRFETEDKLASFVGLVPDTRSSGEKERVLGITGRRNVSLRWVLIEAAWTAARKDPALTLAFNKLCVRMVKPKAIVHIARKLLNRIRFVLRTGQPYVTGVVQ